MVRSIVIAMISIVIMGAISQDVLAADKTSEPEYFSESSASIDQIQFNKISQTDLVYKSVADAKDITVKFRKSIRNADPDDINEIFSEIDLDVSTSRNTLIIKLSHPKHDTIANRIFNKNEWRTTIEVTGPENVGIDMNAKFSKITINSTTGPLTGNLEFSDTRINNLVGTLNARISFGEFHAENLAGSFEIKNEFGKADISVVQLAGNSEISCSFGSARLDLPADEGVDFTIDKSFGSIDFDVTGEWNDNEESQYRVLNNGGYTIGLNVEFGGLNISNDMASVVKMAQHDHTTQKSSGKESLPEPKFESGEIATIDILFPEGNRKLKTADVNEWLGLCEGSSYDRSEISKAVHGLSRKSKFIKWSSFNIDHDGNLSIRIRESESYSWDMDGDSSFSRVGGVGLGPRLTMKSIVGPLSEVSSGAQYHWGNKEWTYDVKAERQFFHSNILAFGGTYRRDYETSMDWAIHRDDSYINAFLLGLETDNYYQVEGSTGYISQSLGKMFKVKAEYFEEDFSSLAKSTNWSLFNSNHWKEGNPALNSSSEGQVTGMRYSVDAAAVFKSVSLDASLTAEDTFSDESRTIADYKRYLADVACTFRLPYRQLWKVRLAGGYSEDALPEQKSFRLGGMNTLRGYDFGAVPDAGEGVDGFDYFGGGNRMMLANIDYYTGGRGDDFGIVFFTDIGNVWSDKEKVDLKDLKRDLGIGLIFEDHIFDFLDRGEDAKHTFRVNWAVPVGPVAHVSHWTVNFVRTY